MPTYMRAMVRSRAAVLAIAFGLSSPGGVVGEILEDWSIPTLEQVAQEDPGQSVEIEVKFRSIQRSPSIAELLEGSGLGLTEIQHKNIGSGGASFMIWPQETNANALQRVEEHFKYTSLTRFYEQETGQRLMPPVSAAAGMGQPQGRLGPGGLLGAGRAVGRVSRDELDAIELPPCNVDDKTAPVSDIHGIPGSLDIEAACGLRINVVKVRGSAQAGVRLAKQVADEAEVTRLPTPGEIMEIRRRMMERAQSTGRPSSQD